MKRQLLQSVIKIAREVGEQVLDIYQQGQFEQRLKADSTPVTSADIVAHQMLVQRLTTLTPNIPILSEEDATIPLNVRKTWSQYWLIDPLDGTQEFITGTGDFATVIALIFNHKPVMGVVYSPVKDTTYFAIKSGGAWKQISNNAWQQLAIKKHSLNDRLLDVTISYRQNQEKTRNRFARHWDCNFVFLGSASLKSCLVAEGKVDCYLRLGLTGEWDTAAVQCIVDEAGGGIWNTNWQPLTYNQRESLENPHFIVIGDLSLPWRNILPHLPC